jgi:hypothetical protein
MIKIENLQEQLTKIGVNMNDIGIGEERENCLNIFGFSRRWYISFLEKGNREVLGIYSSEEEACQEFIKTLKQFL